MKLISVPCVLCNGKGYSTQFNQRIVDGEIKSVREEVTCFACQGLGYVEFEQNDLKKKI